MDLVLKFFGAILLAMLFLGVLELTDFAILALGGVAFAMFFVEGLYSGAPVY